MTFLSRRYKEMLILIFIRKKGIPCESSKFQDLFILKNQKNQNVVCAVEVELAI